MLPAPSSAKPPTAADPAAPAPRFPLPPEGILLGVCREAGKTLALAAPMIAGQVGQMLMGLADSLMVGRLGVTPLAASAFAVGVVNVPLVAGIGLTSSVSVLVSQAHGADKPREAGEVLRHGLFISLLAGLFMAALTCGWAALGGLRHAGQAPEVAAEAHDFLLLMGASIVPALLWQALKQYCEALSRPWMPMTIMAGAVCLNIGLNWALIYGRGGAPALGLTGAGWGTLTARIVMFLALGAVVLRMGGLRAALPPDWRGWTAKLSPARLRALWTLGLPVGVQLLLEVAAFASAALMMGWISAGALAAHQIAITCAATTFMFPLGLSMAISVRIGQAVGANAGRGALRAIGFGGIGLGALMMGVSATGYFLFRRQIAGLFVEDAAVIALTAQLFVVAGIFQLADGVQVVSMGALRGLSDVKAPMFIALASYWLVALPTSYILGFWLRQGPQGVWTGLAAGLAVAAVCLAWRFHRRT